MLLIPQTEVGGPTTPPPQTVHIKSERPRRGLKRATNKPSCVILVSERVKERDLGKDGGVLR